MNPLPFCLLEGTKFFYEKFNTLIYVDLNHKTVMFAPGNLVVFYYSFSKSSDHPRFEEYSFFSIRVL